MSFRSNIIAGWVLAACFVALGLYLTVGSQFRGERPEKMGYPIEGVVEASAEGAGAAAADVPIATLLATADVAAARSKASKWAKAANSLQVALALSQWALELDRNSTAISCALPPEHGKACTGAGLDAAPMLISWIEVASKLEGQDLLLPP